jgi:hypothetical protein
MKVYRVWVGYGKCNKYVCCDYVVENALEQYKTEIVEKIRNKGWKKEVNFTVYEDDEMDANGKTRMKAYTLEGFQEIRTK